MVEYLVWDQGVAGSNPVFPINPENLRFSFFYFKILEKKVRIVAFGLLDDKLFGFC